jgi:hypothetical protein
MRYRLLPTFFIFLLWGIGAQASFADGWDCTTRSMSGPGKGLSGSARMEVNDQTLKWSVLAPDPSNPNAWTEFDEHILENNENGIVAGTWDARTFSNSEPPYDGLGPIIGARIITLDKSNGLLRMGSVLTNGVHEILTGHCVARGR